MALNRLCKLEHSAHPQHGSRAHTTEHGSAQAHCIPPVREWCRPRMLTDTYSSRAVCMVWDTRASQGTAFTNHEQVIKMIVACKHAPMRLTVLRDTAAVAPVPIPSPWAARSVSVKSEKKKNSFLPRRICSRTLMGCFAPPPPPPEGLGCRGGTKQPTSDPLDAAACCCRSRFLLTCALLIMPLHSKTKTRTNPRSRLL